MRRVCPRNPSVPRGVGRDARQDAREMGSWQQTACKRPGGLVTLAPDDPRHGTPTGYNNWRCRCEPCKEADRAAQHLYRERTKLPCSQCGAPRRRRSKTGLCQPCYLDRVKRFAAAKNRCVDCGAPTKSERCDPCSRKARSPRHGTLTMYSAHRCHCDECREAYAVYQSNRRNGRRTAEVGAE